MPDKDFEERLLRTLTAEDKVIVTSIVLTLLLAPLLAGLWFIDEPIIVPPPIISIFLGISVAALLYRFLGGVHNASLTVGALKVTGTTAVLIFIAMWSNEELKAYVPEKQPEVVPFSLESDVIPDRDSWYATSTRTGLPVTLEFPGYDEQQAPPPLNQLNVLRQERELSLKQNGEGIVAYINNGLDMVLGSIPDTELGKVGFYQHDEVAFVPYRVITFSANQREDISKKLPFEVQTTGFSENYTRFSLVSKASGEEIYEGAILLRGAEVFSYRDHHYLISVVQVNHYPEDIDPYAKIYVAEIVVNHS